VPITCCEQHTAAAVQAVEGYRRPPNTAVAIKQVMREAAIIGVFRSIARLMPLIGAGRAAGNVAYAAGGA